MRDDHDPFLGVRHVRHEVLFEKGQGVARVHGAGHGFVVFSVGFARHIRRFQVELHEMDVVPLPTVVAVVTRRRIE